MSQNRGHWYLLTGILIGLILGFGIVQFVSRPSVSESSPGSLSEVYKADYLLMIARAYQVNKDLVRAKARLDLLQESDLVLVLEELAQSIETSGGVLSDAQALAKLAADIRQPQ